MGSAGFMALLMLERQEPSLLPHLPSNLPQGRRFVPPGAGISFPYSTASILVIPCGFFLLKATVRRQPALRLQSLWELEQWLNW